MASNTAFRHRLLPYAEASHRTNTHCFGTGLRLTNHPSSTIRSPFARPLSSCRQCCNQDLILCVCADALLAVPCNPPAIRRTMDIPTHVDTLSGRFHGQWAFLANAPPPLNHDQTRSLPPSSSYIRSDRSSLSRRPPALPFHHLNASRSSLARNNHTGSVGGHSYTSATNPSQPVLQRIHSDVAYSHLHPSPRTPQRRGIMSKDGELPPLHAYSFEGILGSIQEVIEEDLNGIADILGQSRFVLADQHDSHLPPTGEIRAGQLPALAEASSSNERLAGDEVIILNDSASLVEGSQAGSAAYGLLERLQAVPRTRRMHAELSASPARPRMPSSEARNSSPAILAESSIQSSALSPPALPNSPRPSPQLLRLTSTGAATTGAPTSAVVTEAWLPTRASNQAVSELPLLVSDRRHDHAYSHNESEYAGPSASRGSAQMSFAARLRRLVLLQDIQDALIWSAPPRPQQAVRSTSAENHLRDILGKHHVPTGGNMEQTPRTETSDMYL